MESLMISAEQRLARYVTEQPPYNLLDRRIENELVPLCQKYGLGLLPWSGGTFVRDLIGIADLDRFGRNESRLDLQQSPDHLGDGFGG